MTFLLAFTGYAISPSKPADPIQVALDLLLLLLVYSVLLWGGTNAFNSGQDRDSGRVNLLSNPPPLPQGLSMWGLLLKGVASIAGFFVGFWTGLLCVVATILSLFYSWKRMPGRRGKEIPFVDMLINAMGCGLGSVLVGYSFAAQTILHWEPVVVGIGFSLALFGGMPTSQIFQLEEGERNYTSVLGARFVLRLGSVFFLVHLLFMSLCFPPEEISVGVLLPWIAWLLLVAAASFYSWIWSSSPEKGAYRKMIVQMNLMMGSQLSWSVFAWISR